MNVLCPSCGTGYEIPETRLRRDRTLRCAQCGNEWRIAAVVPDAGTGPAGPEAPPAPAELPEPARDEPAAPAELAGPEAPLAPAQTSATLLPTGVLLWTALWIASLLVIGFGLFALWHWRVHVGQHWPASRRLYRVLPGAG